MSKSSAHSSKIRALIKGGIIPYIVVMATYAGAGLSMWGLSLTFLRVISLTGAAVLVGMASVGLVIVLLICPSEEQDSDRP